MKYIFVDLDECLFCARALYSALDITEAQLLLKPNEKLINAVGPLQDDTDDFYASALRPGALELLKALREIPDSKVCVLTSSIQCYARANNIAHGLGFSNTDIYTREDLKYGALNPELFGSGPVYLIDNLPRYENGLKLKFLRDIAQPAKYINYIQVREYRAMDDMGDMPFSAESIADILQAINDLGVS